MNFAHEDWDELEEAVKQGDPVRVASAALRFFSEAVEAIADKARIEQGRVADMGIARTLADMRLTVRGIEVLTAKAESRLGYCEFRIAAMEMALAEHGINIDEAVSRASQRIADGEGGGA